MENGDLYQTLRQELENRYLVELREKDPDIRAMTLAQIERLEAMQSNLTDTQFRTLSDFIDHENALNAQRMQHLFMAGAKECVNILRELGVIK